MGLFSRLFGKPKQQEPVQVEPIEYKGFMIYQEPISENGQFRVAGRITQEINGELKPIVLFALIWFLIKRMRKS